jgi:hypothetical protein
MSASVFGALIPADTGSIGVQNITVRDNPIVYPTIKIGVLGQFHIMSSQTITPGAGNEVGAYSRVWERQLYVRRLRILAGGNISERTSFFIDTDAPNIGYVDASGVKNTRVSMYIQDAQIQHNYTDAHGVVAGLQIVGITRNGLQSAASLMALNYGSYQFFANGPLDNLVGRDLGVALRGFVFDERLEYRTGIYSGRNDDRPSSYRFTGRFNYSLLDREKGFFYPGTMLGRGRVFSVGGGVDTQDNYLGIAMDTFFDYPVFQFGSVTASVSYAFINNRTARNTGNDFSALLPRQDILFTETGLFIPAIGIQPYFKYERKNVRKRGTENTLQNRLNSGDRAGFGVNYFMAGHQFNVKFLFERVYGNYPSGDPIQYTIVARNEFVLQIQYFSF